MNALRLVMASTSAAQAHANFRSVGIRLSGRDIFRMLSATKGVFEMYLLS
jgi:hypothetical protein